MKKAEKKPIALILVSVLLIVVGTAYIFSFLYELFNGSFVNVIHKYVNGDYYEPLSWKIQYILRFFFGLICVLLGIILFKGKKPKKILIIFVIVSFVEIIIPLFLRPQVYLTNWSYVPKLVNTAIKEYEESGDNKNLYTDMENEIHGKETGEISKSFQRGVDQQNDYNTVIAYLGGLTTAIICWYLTGRKKTNP